MRAGLVDGGGRTVGKSGAGLPAAAGAALDERAERARAQAGR